jgi:aminoglycoside phosphotransferase family enzyme
METVVDTPGIEARLRYLESTLARASIDEPVRRIETHMSWLLLGGERVLKLKKPVRFPFLDFTTVQARERNAHTELRVNRRLAPSVYLGVLALQWDDGVFSLVAEEQLPAPGRTIDWLVSMQRLPAERMLDRVIACGELRQRDIDALLEVLVPFYRHAPRPALGEDEYLRRLRDESAASRNVLASPRFGLPQSHRLLDRMDRAMVRHEEMLRARVRGRRIVEGHGDLRPEHVCLIDPPVIIDALEFDVRLREVDPLDELSFLSLECAMAGDAAIGPQLLAHCADALDDPPPAALLRLYTAQRALLRARLSVAHLFEADARTPQKWLPQAGRYLQHAGDALDGLEALEVQRSS